jgi:hypothetical protein
MPKYYVFKGISDSTLIVTADRTAASLPRHPVSSWEFFKEMEFHRGGAGVIGASPDEVIDAVERVGYYKC